MKNSRILLIGAAAGLLVAVCLMVAGHGFMFAAAMMVSETVFCSGLIYFFINIMPELNSRYTERQFKRNPEKMEQKARRSMPVDYTP